MVYHHVHCQSNLGGSPFFTSFTTEYSSRRRCGGNHFARDCTEPGGTKSIFIEISSGEKYALGYPVILSLQFIILVQNCAALPLPLLPCWTLASLGFVSSLLRLHDESWYICNHCALTAQTSAERIASRASASGAPFTFTAMWGWIMPCFTLQNTSITCENRFLQLLRLSTKPVVQYCWLLSGASLVKRTFLFVTWTRRHSGP